MKLNQKDYLMYHLCLLGFYEWGRGEWSHSEFVFTPTHTHNKKKYNESMRVCVHTIANCVEIYKMRRTFFFMFYSTNALHLNPYLPKHIHTIDTTCTLTHSHAHINFELDFMESLIYIMGTLTESNAINSCSKPPISFEFMRPKFVTN